MSEGTTGGAVRGRQAEEASGPQGSAHGTLVEEVDGLHAGVLLVADLQLVELAKQINQPLHHLHAIFTEAEESERESRTLERWSGSSTRPTNRFILMTNEQGPSHGDQ